MTEVETTIEDRGGRMRLKIVHKPGKYGLQYSAIIYRPYKKAEDEQGKPIWEQTHWLDEQDVLNSLRLHEVADDVIAEAKRKDSFQPANEVA